MFTGIIQSLGKTSSFEPLVSDARIVVEAGRAFVEQIAPGDSVAVNGVCLTAVEMQGNAFTADVSNETLSRTTLRELRAGTTVNLELALTPLSRMGGHIVSGHVDGIGTILKQYADGRSMRFRIAMPRHLARYVAPKGSIGVDGISLTVNEADTESFQVNIVPHTLSATNLGTAAAGQKVNLEVDLLARYLERLLDERNRDSGQIDVETLKKAGFL